MDNVCYEGHERSGSTDVVLTVPVTVDGNVEDLRLFEGESYEDAATAFARTNGLMNLKDPNKAQQIIQQLSSLLKERALGLQSSEPTLDDNVSERTVQLTIPLTIDGSSTQLVKYKEENAEHAVTRFFSSFSLTEDTQAQLVPQLLSLIQTRLEEIQSRKRELFSFTVTIDGKDTVVRHYQDGNPEEEAHDVLKALDMDAMTIQELSSQIEAEILKRVNAQSSETSMATPQRELFSVQITINDVATNLVHNEGDALEESASLFLNKHGITDEESVQSYMPQLLDILRAKLEALQPSQEETKSTVHDKNSFLKEEVIAEPFVTINVQLEEGREALLRYYEGDDIGATVKYFLESFEIAEDELYQQNFQHLVNLLKDRVKARLEELSQAEKHQSTTMFTVPVSLGGIKHIFEYHEGQEPLRAVSNFCRERFQAMRADNSVEIDDSQMQECENVLASHIERILKQPIPREEQDTAQDADYGDDISELNTTDLLFTIDIDIGDSRIVQLRYHHGQDPNSVARAFCEQYKIDVANVPMLVTIVGSEKLCSQFC
uniref:Uncharacterized protein AlNc14C17G1805 n=1 Tax=Albugo laibachii Nc14 TaxID=890382 RepID=F0W4I4_9STRA|nr:conserved hypothetical protein [Albugo laibachii Nc14]|eukprot:CCA16017.1 conserved hypothetical protein [Albugo laibachii Nc14]